MLKRYIWNSYVDLSENEKCASFRCIVSAIRPAYPRHIGIVLKLKYYGMYSHAQNLSHVSIKPIKMLENGAKM